MTLGITFLILAAIVFFILRRNKEVGTVVRNLTVAEAKDLINENGAVPLDVRTSAEIRSGTIDGALKLNVTSLNFAKGLEKLEKDQTYVVYCRSGKRSLRACKIMSKSGFTDVYNLEGGYLAYN